VAEPVVMPRLGWTMEVGSVVEWHKRDGDPVKAGEPLLAIESDKAISDVEALASGILRLPPDSPGIGVAVPIGTVLAYVVAEGEDLGATDPSPVPCPEEGGVSREEAPGSPVSDGQGESQGPAVVAVAPAQDTGLSARGRRGEPAASPRAKRAAAALGIDWRGLRGSGTSGRISERDVREAAARATPQTVPEIVPSVVGQSPTADGGAALGPIQRVIAARMVESRATTAPVTLTTEADATELVRTRAALAADAGALGGPVPTITDLFVRLAAVALLDHPALNASLIEGRIVQHPAVHVGIAVDAERGLIVPVLRDAGGKSLQRIAAESAPLIAAARAGELGPDDLRGGTFTITNLGPYEIDAFTPIINLPECAILGVGRLVARPVVTDEAAETIAVRRMVALSLTFDHQIVDGGPAARFLQTIKGFVERPLRWLTR
jgi:pyruvate dehydrogenase E2 component (dihydrolipoamide acetyltransferase)